MVKAKRTWIVMADGGRATVLLNEGPGKGMHPVDGARFTNPSAHLHSRDIGSDRPGRSVESVGGSRHAIAPRSDPHRQRESEFAKSVASYLDRAAQERRFDSLVLVAPPAMLGDLRGMLGKHAAGLVSAEIGKDLMKTPMHELASHLSPAIRL